MKRFLSFTLAILVTIALLGYGVLSYTTEKNRAVPGEPAKAALVSDDAVNVNYDDWLVMRPTGASPAIGVIIYPGANCDIRGYAAIMHAVAAQGYLVVGTPMPFNFAFLHPNAADDVRDAYPEISHWVIIGHSLGGAMAGQYVAENLGQNWLSGVIFWDSYPPEWASLADSDMPITNIFRATLAGDPPEKFQEMRHLYPPQALQVPIKGGIHMYFGNFIGGPYKEVWEPKITNAEQVRQVTAATLQGLAAVQ